MKKRNFKRVVVISDQHAGHRVGLTPPKWWTQILGNKWYRTQMDLWNEFAKGIDGLKPIDILIVNGDCIDGRGKMSGGTELITGNRMKQVEIASFAINYCEAKKVVITRGTPYHVGHLEEWEDMVKDQTNANKIGDHEWYNVNGVVFDVKHKIGGSSIPHGQHTAIAKDRLWNLHWAEVGSQPKADIIIRSHVHYFSVSQKDNWFGVITPALQGMGSKFGAKECSNLVDWGFIWFDVLNKPKRGENQWEMGRYIKRLESQKATITNL